MLGLVSISLLLLDRCEIVAYDGDEKISHRINEFFSFGYQYRLGIFFGWRSKFVEIARERSFMGWNGQDRLSGWVDYCACCCCCCCCCCCGTKWLEKVCVSMMGKLDVSFLSGRIGIHSSSCSTICSSRTCPWCVPCLSHCLIVIQLCYSYSYSYSCSFFFTVSVRWSKAKEKKILLCLLKWYFFYIYLVVVLYGIESFFVKRMVVELKKIS